MKCEECGDTIDHNSAPGILAEAYDGEVQCEGCAEDTLDSIISAIGDGRESGMWAADEYQE